MRLVVFLMVTLISVSAVNAAPERYSVELDVAVNGEQVFSPTMELVKGETKTVVKRIGDIRNYFQVEAVGHSPNNPKNIELKMTVGFEDINGERTVLAQPKIMTLVGEGGSIETKDGSGGSVAIKVLAKHLK